MAAIDSITPATNAIWKRWFTAPAALTRGEERFYGVCAAVFPFTLLAHFFFIFLFIFWGVRPLAIFNIFSAILWMVVIILLKHQRFLLVFVLGAAEVIIHQTLVIIFIGWGFGAQYLILVTFVMTVTNAWLKRWMNIGLSAVYIAIFIGWYYYTEFFPPLAAAPPLQLAIINILITSFSFLLIGGSLMYLVSEAESANQVNEDLLNNVLPKPIANRLKQKESTIADGFQNASILFADLTGFTRLSLKLAPDDLVQMLDRIFSRFDGLVDQYGLEKIKTIGDEYMVASGIPIPRDDHAQALANFALAMRDSLDEHNQIAGINLQLRIGLNSGPVVAGVIGKRRFLYDLWGDSVNTASRMESHGIPGEIQVTEATRDLLDGRFSFIDRGLIDIKGKGPMRTYLLQAK